MGAPNGTGGNGGGPAHHGDVMVAEPKTKTQRPPMYKVVLLNDDYTPMDFVVSVLEQIFHHSHSQAMERMLQIHNRGAAIAGIYTRDVAETKADQVTEYARINDCPLQCTLEQDS